MFGKDKDAKNSDDLALSSFAQQMNGSLPKLDKHLSKSSSTTLIARDTEVLGDIKFTGDLEVEGSIIGSIIANNGSEASVRVLENGQVKGDIAAPKVAINGSVKGAVHASILELATNARVDGDVHYSSIEMMRGAQVNGNLLFSETLNAMDAAKASATDEAVDEPEKTGETS